MNIVKVLFVMAITLSSLYAKSFCGENREHPICNALTLQTIEVQKPIKLKTWSSTSDNHSIEVALTNGF